MIFLLLFKNLKCLRVGLKYDEKTTDVDEESVQVDKDGTLRLGQLTLRIKSGLKIRIHQVVKEFTKSEISSNSEISFKLSVDLEESDEVNTRMDPPRMPINKEILTDWIYCHSHDNSVSCDVLNDEEDVLTDMNQISFLLKRMPVASQVLLESENHVDNIIVNVVNTNCACGFSSLNDDFKGTVELKSSIGVQFKLLSTKENLPELKKFRHSFHTEYHRISNTLFSKLSNVLTDTSTQILPAADQHNPDDDFVNSYFLTV